MHISIEPIIYRLVVRFSFFLEADVIAALLELSLDTTQQVLAHWRETGYVPEVPATQEVVLNPTQRHTGVPHREIAEDKHRGAASSTPTVSRTLKRRRSIVEKLSQEALERNKHKRNRYTILIGLEYSREQLVFVDEGGFKKLRASRSNLGVLRGWRAPHRQRGIRNRQYTVLPAMSLSGMVDVKVVQGSITTEVFHKFIESVLDEMNPFPQPDSVLVMDNATVHKEPWIRQVVEARGMRLIYLPYNSPDLNPAEEAFPAMMAWIQQNRRFVKAILDLGGNDPGARALLVAAKHVITPEKAEEWYRDLGY